MEAFGLFSACFLVVMLLCLPFSLPIYMLPRNSVSFGMVKTQSKEYSAFGGAVFLCNQLTRKECFNKKIFGLSPYCSDFVEKVKAGTTLFLYDVEQCKLHGVFEATSDGAVNIIPDAYGRRYPSQA